MSTSLDEIQQLDIAERIQLIEDLWDSVVARTSNFAITDFQNAVEPFASMCRSMNRTSHPCVSSENAVAVFAQVAPLLQKHLRIY